VDNRDAPNSRVARVGWLRGFPKVLTVLLSLITALVAFATAVINSGYDLTPLFSNFASPLEQPKKEPTNEEGSGELTEEPSAAKEETTVADLRANLQSEAEDYFEAVDNEDWPYTFNNLASQTQRMFAGTEWQLKNAWFAEYYPAKLKSVDISDKNLSTSEPADLTVYRALPDGPCTYQDIQFVYEDGSWKHQFSREETEAFMPGTPYEEFVLARRQGLPDGGQPSTEQQENAVESAVRGHYRAIGDRKFEEAYCYFGPTQRDDSRGQEQWIAGQKPNQITSSSIDSLEVEDVSGNTATAAVEVAITDKTGTHHFQITWSLLKEDGRWKLDKQILGKKID
jgi:hypothetical protein